MMHVVAGALVAIHVGLVAWSVMGLSEWLGLPTPWPRLSNALLPGPILLAQWVFVLCAGSVFCWGYATRWRHTRSAMAVTYACMAGLCAIQNLLYLEQYASMALEYATYATILVLLFRAHHFRKRFS